MGNNNPLLMAGVYQISFRHPNGLIGAVSFLTEEDLGAEDVRDLAYLLIADLQAEEEIPADIVTLELQQFVANDLHSEIAAPPPEDQ